MRFEWDRDKAASNQKKHRVSFDEAVTVFYDPLAPTFGDPDHSDDKDRFIAVGYSSDRRLLVVAMPSVEPRFALSAREEQTLKKENVMKRKKTATDDLRSNYVFDYSKAVRGKHYQKLIKEGANVVVSNLTLLKRFAARRW